MSKEEKKKEKAYLKGLDVIGLSNHAANKLNLDKGFDGIVSKEEMIKKTEEVHKYFIDENQEEHKFTEAGLAYALTKKENKEKRIIGLAFFKRVGKPSKKTFLFFDEPGDVIEQNGYYVLPEFEKETEFFDKYIVEFLKEHVGFDEVHEAHFKDSVMKKKKNVDVLGLKIATGLFFILVWVAFGYIFKSMALGLLWALILTTSCSVAVSSVKSDKTKSNDGEINEDDSESEDD